MSDDKELDYALDNVGVFLAILSRTRQAQEVSPQLAKEILNQYRTVAAAARRAQKSREEVCEWEWDDAHMETVRACDGLLCENGRHLKYDTGDWEDDTICGGCGRRIVVKE